jgi:uncharacterized surface protein with fasciclin (FAS1) repeats
MLQSLIKKTVVIFSVLMLLSGSIFVPTAQAATGDIVDVAINAPQFSTLVAAVKAADLVSTLQGTGPFTVLAPTNEAFAKVPADVLAKLLLPENKAALTKVLTYHVVAGKVNASEIVKLTTAKTVEGSNIKIAVVSGKVMLNDKTTVVATDVSATNGIIHGIDSVLLPADLDLATLKSASTTATTTESPKGHTTRTGGASEVNNFNIYSLVAVISLGLVAAFVSSKLLSSSKN